MVQNKTKNVCYICSQIGIWPSITGGIISSLFELREYILANILSKTHMSRSHICYNCMMQVKIIMKFVKNHLYISYKFRIAFKMILLDKNTSSTEICMGLNYGNLFLYSSSCQCNWNCENDIPRNYGIGNVSVNNRKKAVNKSYFMRKNPSLTVSGNTRNKCITNTQHRCTQGLEGIRNPRLRMMNLLKIAPSSITSSQLFHVNSNGNVALDGTRLFSFYAIRNQCILPSMVMHHRRNLFTLATKTHKKMYRLRALLRDKCFCETHSATFRIGLHMRQHYLLRLIKEGAFHLVNTKCLPRRTNYNCHIFLSPDSNLSLLLFNFFSLNILPFDRDSLMLRDNCSSILADSSRSLQRHKILTYKNCFVIPYHSSNLETSTSSTGMNYCLFSKKINFIAPLSHPHPHSSHRRCAPLMTMCNLNSCPNPHSQIGAEITPHDRNAVHLCYLCGESFVNKMNLTNHKKQRHKGGKPFTCSECDQSFSRKDSLDQHSYHRHGMRINVCHICNKSFYLIRSLKQHVLIHTDVKPHSCSVCAKAFLHKSTLTRHLKSHFGDQPYSCTLCAKTFTSKVNCKKHVLRHTTNPYVCGVCNAAYTDNKQLRRHCLSHTGGKLYSCSVCNHTFLSKAGLRVHSRIHSGEKRYSCSMCSRRFRYRRSLHMHSNLHTEKMSNEVLSRTTCHPDAFKGHSESTINAYTCSLCNKGFSQKQHLRFHLRFHTSQQAEQSCTVCGEKYATKKGLAIHIRRHKNVAAYSCSHCSASFTANRDLDVHLFRQHGIKSYSCPVCNKMFMQKEMLNAHAFLHTGVKPFECTMCVKSFVHKYMLKAHLGLHRGDNVNHCSICDKVFAYKRDLTIHLRSHTGEKPYVCAECNKSFTSSSRLNRHLKTHARNC